MKREMYVHITNPESFAAGNLEYTVSLYPKRVSMPDWIYVGSVVIDFSTALDELDNRIQARIAAVRKELASVETYAQRKADELVEQLNNLMERGEQLAEERGCTVYESPEDRYHGA